MGGCHPRGAHAPTTPPGAPARTDRQTGRPVPRAAPMASERSAKQAPVWTVRSRLRYALYALEQSLWLDKPRGLVQMATGSGKTFTAAEVEATLGLPVLAVLPEARGRPEHIVRLTWYVLDRQEYLGALPAVGEAYRELMGRHFPVMAVVQVVALMEAQPCTLTRNLPSPKARRMRTAPGASGLASAIRRAFT